MNPRRTSGQRAEAVFRLEGSGRRRQGSDTSREWSNDRVHGFFNFLDATLDQLEPRGDAVEQLRVLVGNSAAESQAKRFPARRDEVFADRPCAPRVAPVEIEPRR